MDVVKKYEELLGMITDENVKQHLDGAGSLLIQSLKLAPLKYQPTILAQIIVSYIRTLPENKQMGSKHVLDRELMLSMLEGSKDQNYVAMDELVFIADTAAVCVNAVAAGNAAKLDGITSCFMTELKERSDAIDQEYQEINKKIEQFHESGMPQHEIEKRVQELMDAKHGKGNTRIKVLCDTE